MEYVIFQDVLLNSPPWDEQVDEQARRYESIQVFQDMIMSVLVLVMMYFLVLPVSRCVEIIGKGRPFPFHGIEKLL